MPHTLNIDGLSEGLFFLQNLCHASRSFCQKHQVEWRGDHGSEFDWEYYFGWLKSSLCEHLIKTAITLRMLEDIVAHDSEGEFKTSKYYAEACQGLELGTVVEGTFTLSLREAFNKIVHATDTQLDWNKEEGYQWWSGSVFLYGKKGQQEWKVRLDVESFAIAAHRFIESIGSNLDWHHLYKYDR